jgi:hypothetical protein
LISRNARLDQAGKAQMIAEQELREALGRELDLIEALLPNIDLLRDSREVLRNGLRNRRSALTILRELSARPGLVRGTPIEGAGGWFERHFSTGDRPTGRLYYRCRGERCSVLISLKAQQDDDIQYLETV